MNLIATLPVPNFEDEASLYSLSSEFLEAAMVLANTPPKVISYKLVTYYLAGHAAELLLKSFLYKNGDSIDVLRNRYGHNLKLLVKKAELKGLLTNVSTVHIQKFANAYTSKQTEYRKKETLALPPLDLLIHEIKALQSNVFDHIAEL